jgi:RNA polymerase sigma-70 factor (ECF subfamily)
LIEEALAGVNPKFRAALVLREIEGLSYGEVAEILEISLGTVKSRILRGREALRKQIMVRLEAGSTLAWSPQLAE